MLLSRRRLLLQSELSSQIVGLFVRFSCSSAFLFSSYIRQFLPARRYASAGLYDSDVSVRLSVCLDVRHTPVLCLAERKEDREMYTT